MNNLALSCVGLMEANFQIDSPIVFFGIFQEVPEPGEIVV